ncbi:tyrosine-type recombinase/integrase [Cupriavidus taiwanensis]|uniref:tyrosine-type recombinase/integrase n=1 Tax=Cupriavidus taiwanensis TaxID=164546 RepID=UPI000E1AD54D|nr:tyrosine-type recombinase/integrase [Cupriavidus taiwanensis]SPA44656.1 Integrase family protein [Cupriavidus taiwanensis]
MSRARNPENKGLPARWCQRHGAYFYRVPPGLEAMWDGKQMFRLGSSLPEAYKVWSDRLADTDKTKTVADLLDRYSLQVVPTKAKTTQQSNQVCIARLRSVLGTAPLSAIRPQTVYQYIDKRKAKVSAHREIEILSHAFTKAVEWGIIDRHPFKGEVRLTGEKPRTRYVEDWEIVECLALESKRSRGSVLAIQAYIRIKLITGLRRGDLLRLTMSNLKDDGIHVTPGKTAGSTGKSIILTWTDELRAAVEMAKAARPVRIAPWLFCNRDGECYFNDDGRAGGWDTMWRNFMGRVLKETEVKQRFNEHDLRAKCASDADSLEHAQALMAHADSRLTERVYRRKPQVVQPLR